MYKRQLGGLGSDTIDGGSGGDNVDGGDGSDFIYGADGSDDIDGGLGDDAIDGGFGSDFIDGGEGDDDLSGGDGSDTLTGGSGFDVIDGGEGADVAFFSGLQGDYTFASSEDGLTVTVTDRSTGDADTVTNVETLSFDDGDIGVSHDGTGLVLTGLSTDSIEVVGSVGVTVLGEAGDDTLDGGLGSDTLDGGEGNDTLLGQDGSDMLTGGTGSDVIDGGEGADVAFFSGHQGDYTFASSEDGLTVTVTDRSTGDVDTVTNVETLRFDEVTLLSPMTGWVSS